MKLWLDTETYSETPIKCGTYVYAENCEVDIAAYAIDDGPVEVLDLANEPRTRQVLAKLIEDAETIIAHNAMFDRNALRLGNLKIDSPIEKWRCSMVRAMAHGLPGSLDKLGEIVGLEQDQRKHKEGKALMQLFCKPQPFRHSLLAGSFPSKKHYLAAVAEAREAWAGRATKATHPKEWAAYLEYAKNDVIAMRAIDAKLPAWNYTFDPPGQDRPRDRELALWHRDQRINDRGFHVDLALVDAAIEAVAKEQGRLKAQTRDLTGYDSEAGEGLGSTTQRDEMLAYLLKAESVSLPDLRADTLERRLVDDNISDAVKELIRIRLQASSTSTTKYRALKRGVQKSGRMGGTIQFDGAKRTRRAAGRTFQPQNLPSRGLLPAPLIELGAQALLDGSEDLLFDNIMLLTTSTIRSAVTAGPGRKLVASDLSNIEGRGLAWLAGEEWKLQAFRDFDICLGVDGSWYSGECIRTAALAREYIPLARDEKGELIHFGPDLYKLAYAKAFRVDPAGVNKFGRSIGKVMELALGYAGGINAFVTFAAVYGIDLEEMAAIAGPALPPETVLEAEDFLDWQAGQGRTYPMSRKAAITCEVFKRLWRAAHPAVVAMWAGLESGFREAIDSPGKTLTRGKFKVRRDNAWVRIVLPSGRTLCYPFPRIVDGKIVFKGENQYTRKWSDITTFSGKIAENATQSFARDILYDAMPRIEDAGYPIVLHVHDEVVTEPEDTDRYNEAELSALLSVPPDYAPDMPLAAAGYESYRYKKD